MSRPFLLAACLLLAACAEQATAPPTTTTPAPDVLTLNRVGFDRLPGWAGDQVGEALPAVKSSCGRLMGQAADRAVGPNGLGGTVADWRAFCTAAATATPDQLRSLVEQQMVPFQAVSRDGPEGLFTGYYEPELRGARVADARYKVPLYKRPDDMVVIDLGEFRADLKGQQITGQLRDGRLHPYPDRAAIDAGALKDKRLELVWVDDAVDAFFLQVQGSGRVVLADGGTMRVGYAAQNGRAYSAIGRELIARGAIPADQVSLQTIRAWLAAHPTEAPAVMATNPSYVFFREVTGPAPLGAQGVALTPGRSVAVDPAFLALGTPLWLDIDDPVSSGGRLRRLVVAQDTGGAIKGAVRADVFWGTGAAAGERAGPMKQRGGYFVLLPSSVAARRTPIS